MLKAINLLLIDRKVGKILAIKRKKNDQYFPNMWALPGGQIEKGESLRETALRELKEETGLTLDRFGTQTLFKGELNIHGKKLTILIHEASAKPGKVSPTDSDIAQAKWIGLDELISSLIMNQYPRAQIQKISQLITQKLDKNP
jgi:8-oxo-dGTP pyrophosphatase MutT (NUDIX family)